MILHTEAGLQSTHDALMNLQMGLWSLFQERAEHGKIGYPILAESWVAEIFKLRKQIDDAIGLTEYVAEFGVPPTNEEIDAMAALPSESANGTATAAHQPTTV